MPLIWLVGNRGMLGAEVEILLKRHSYPYLASDLEVDITDFESLNHFTKGKFPTWIINCAAYTAVDRAEDEPEKAFAINAAGPGNLAQIARDKGARLIHISTDYVFDGTKNGAYVETDPPRPLGVYARSKYQGEVKIQANIKEYFILRTAWLYGKNGSNFVATMLKLFNERDYVTVVGDQWGSPTYAPDLAEAVLEIVRRDCMAYGIYHFTNEGLITWYDFACEIYRQALERGILTGKVSIRRITTEEYPTKAKRPKNAYLSKEKFIGTFEIIPRSWDSALADYFRSEGQRSW